MAGPVALFLIVGPTDGREVDSQTDGLVLNVSLPLPTLPEGPDPLKEMASDETWETAVGGALSYYVEGCIDHISDGTNQSSFLWGLELDMNWHGIG